MTPLHPPLTDYGRRLLAAVLAAHGQSCERQNISTQAVINTAAGSGAYTTAIAGAILTIGGLDAPLAATMGLLQSANPVADVLLCIENGWCVPGWGNSFERRHPDPDWQDVHAILFEDERWASTVGQITKTLHDSGKNIFPNPSAYTAACAIEIGLPAALASYLFIAGRLRAWTSLVAGVLTPSALRGT